jgi:tripartite-type tricarboxylate transporter receptor subunit TctC
MANLLTRRTLLGVASSVSALSALWSTTSTHAASWPTEPVKIVLPFTPGGSDVLFRLMAPKLSDIWGKPVVIDYKPGASNIVATEYVLRAKPDGHTLGVTGATLTSNPLFYKKIPYTVDDLEGVSRLVNIEMVLVANNAKPFNNISELVRYAKANPGELTWGTGGLGATYAGFLRLLQAAGIQMVHINFQGTPQAHNELMGDRLDLVVNPFAASQQFVTAGKMKQIASFGPKRIASVPNSATVSETYPGVEITPYYALIAPKNTPREIIQKIQQDSSTVLRMPEIQKQVAALGLETLATTPEETNAFFRSETKEWQRIARLIKLPPP